MNRILLFWYEIKHFLNIYKRPVKFLAFWYRVGSIITLLSVRSTQIYTRSIGWDKFFETGNFRFQISRWKTIILNHNAVLFASTSKYVTTTSFLTLPIHYECKNNPGIVFTCELAETVKLYREIISQADGESHFFQNRGIVFRAVCLTL
jgi:hypothetical protein